MVEQKVRAKTMKERLHSVKNDSNFEIAAPFHHLYGEEKRAAISKLELFLNQWSRSYFVFALVNIAIAFYSRYYAEHYLLLYHISNS